MKNLISKLSALVKRNLIITTLIILAIVLAIVTTNNVELQKPKSLEEVQLSEITPGKTTEAEVISKLGNPRQISTKNQDKTYIFDSDNPNIDHEVYFKDAKVSFIREIINPEDKNKTWFTDKYGQPTHKLYGPLLNAGFILYVYPEKGAAFIGMEESDYVLEGWLFTPTDIDNFIETHAPLYTKDRSSATDGRY